MAEVLELNLTGPREKCYGIPGDAEAVQTRVKIAVSKGHERYVMTVPVKVLLIENTMIPLLGQVGFFDEFKVTFDKKAHKVSLKKVSTGDRRTRQNGV